MLVAKQKRKQNIAEYVLYLYQIEDLIRAFKFDIELIENRLVPSYQTDEATSKEIIDWYNNLLTMMEKEQIQEKGHLQFLQNLISDVNDFHLKLTQTTEQKLYIENFHQIAGLLAELKMKNRTADNDIQLALDTIYGYLLLKMKKTEVSKGTEEAVKRLSSWLSKLSKLYKDFETGDLSL